MTLTESQRTLLLSALRIARETYLQSAKGMEKLPGFVGVQKQFEMQAYDALELANMIDNAASVEVKEHAPEHTKVRHGKCPVCGHYGEDCTGEVQA
jgi:hypothetical protein